MVPAKCATIRLALVTHPHQEKILTKYQTKQFTKGQLLRPPARGAFVWWNQNCLFIQLFIKKMFMQMNLVIFIKLYHVYSKI